MCVRVCARPWVPPFPLPAIFLSSRPFRGHTHILPGQLVEWGLLQWAFPHSETRHLELDIWNQREDLAHTREQEVGLGKALRGRRKKLLEMS